MHFLLGGWGGGGWGQAGCIMGDAQMANWTALDMLEETF